MRPRFRHAMLGAALAAALGTSPPATAETVLHRGNGAEIESLDPARHETIPGLNVVLDAYEGLTVYGPDGRVAGGVAERWDISDDGRTYRFHLRENARWSNGDPVTAHDYVYSWIRVLDPKTKSPYAFFLDRIKGANAFRTGRTTDSATVGVRALDARTLEVELENPTPFFLVMLHSPATFAVHRATVEKFGDDWTRPEHFVGNGAYRLTEWKPNVRMVFVRNERYWDAKNVKIDKVVFYPIEEASEELTKFTKGELDVTYTVPDSLHDVLKARYESEYKPSDYFGTYYYQFNTSKPPFDNPQLRRALALAIDRDHIVRNITHGGEVPAYGLVPPGVAGYENPVADFKAMSQAQREAEAAAIMRDLGYSEARPLKLEILYNTAERHRLVSLALSEMWRKIHVDATLTNIEFKDVTERRRRGDFEVNRASWIGDYVDPMTFLENLTVGAQQNDPRYRNAAYTDLVLGSNAIADRAARMDQLERAEAMMLADLPVVPLYHYVNKRLVSRKVEGWRVNVLGYVLSQWLSKAD